MLGFYGHMYTHVGGTVKYMFDEKMRLISNKCKQIQLWQEVANPVTIRALHISRNENHCA